MSNYACFQYYVNAVGFRHTQCSLFCRIKDYPLSCKHNSFLFINFFLLKFRVYNISFENYIIYYLKLNQRCGGAEDGRMRSRG